jgi:hypothetical protein
MTAEERLSNLLARILNLTTSLIRRSITVTAFVVLGFSTLIQWATYWNNPLAIVGETIFSLYVIAYFTVLEYSKARKWFIASETGEQAGILLVNGKPDIMHVFSDNYHADGWEIETGKESSNYFAQLLVKNARWIGPSWQNKMRPVSFVLKEFTKIGDGANTKLVRRKKECNYPDGLVDLFHSHAYITEELEIADNFHVIEYFYLRFRFTNMYEAFINTDYFVHNMEAIVLDCARGVSADKTVDKLRELDKKDFGDRIKELVNTRLSDYGVEVIDVQFIDFDQTRVEEEEAQKAIGIANLKAKALITEKTAEAEGKRLVQKVDVDLEVARVRRMRIASKGDPAFVTAYAFTKNTGLKVIGGGVIPTLNIDDPTDQKPDKK